MSFKMRRRIRHRRGFTLVELLVVVLIVETLIAVALPAYLSAVYSSRQETANANAKSLAIAVQSKGVVAGTYDVTLTDYATDLGGSVPLNPCTGTTTGYTVTTGTGTATVQATAGTNCGTWAPVIYSLTL